MSTQQPDLPQLDMRCNKFDDLPEVVIPDGYVMDTFETRGVNDWIEVLNATNQLGEWDQEKAKTWIEGERSIIKQGTFFILFNDRPVASACTIPPGSEEKRPEIGWITVSPDHQGKKLGYQVTLAGLRFLKSREYSETFLHTDDWRLPAIKTYLNLGFEPELTHESHPDRWQAIYERLRIK